MSVETLQQCLRTTQTLDRYALGNLVLHCIAFQPVQFAEIRYLVADAGPKPAARVTIQTRAKKTAIKEPIVEVPAEVDTGIAGIVAIAGGAVANPIMLWSEYTLKTTGAGLPPGPGGALGAAGACQLRAGLQRHQRIGDVFLLMDSCHLSGAVHLADASCRLGTSSAAAVAGWYVSRCDNEGRQHHPRKYIPCQARACI